MYIMLKKYSKLEGEPTITNFKYITVARKICDIIKVFRINPTVPTIIILYYSKKKRK